MTQRLERDAKPRPGYAGSGAASGAKGSSGPSGGAGTADGRKGQHYSGPTVRIYVGVGRKDGVRPQDLVGAIANQTELTGREIGPINIADRFATVGVPESAAEDVMAALKRTTLKGKKTTIRLSPDGR